MVSVHAADPRAMLPPTVCVFSPVSGGPALGVAVLGHWTCLGRAPSPLHTLCAGASTSRSPDMWSCPSVPIVTCPATGRAMSLQGEAGRQSLSAFPDHLTWSSSRQTLSRLEPAWSPVLPRVRTPGAGRRERWRGPGLAVRPERQGILGPRLILKCGQRTHSPGCPHGAPTVLPMSPMAPS